MDLRSAHKAPEKPQARLRLSLTRSLDSGAEEQTYEACRRSLPPRLDDLKNQPHRSQFVCLTAPPRSPTPTQNKDWGGREEGNEDEEDMEEEEEEVRQESVRQTEICSDMLNGKSLYMCMLIYSPYKLWCHILVHGLRVRHVGCLADNQNCCSIIMFVKQSVLCQEIMCAMWAVISILFHSFKMFVRLREERDT